MKTRQYSMQCPQCGHEKFERPEFPQDHDLVRCNFCDHKITIAELREANEEQIMQTGKEFAKEVLAQEINKLKKKFR